MQQIMRAIGILFPRPLTKAEDVKARLTKIRLETLAEKEKAQWDKQS